MSPILEHLTGNFQHSTKQIVDLVELDFVVRTLEELLLIMPYMLSEYEFTLTSSNGREDPPTPLVLPESSRKRVLIYLSDETGSVPTHLSRYFFAIFKCYLPQERLNGNIFAFPLGYTNGPPNGALVQFENRKYDVSFIGNLNYNRWPLCRSFSMLRFLPFMPYPIERRMMAWFAKSLPRQWEDQLGKSLISFTAGFRNGLGREKYSELLANSRIVLCPPGWRSPECFRHYEAMREGCIVLSSRLPPTHFYQKAPMVEVNDWSKVYEIIRDLLRNPFRMLELHKFTKDWWKNVCSETAVANHIKHCLSLVESEKVKQ